MSAYSEAMEVLRAHPDDIVALPRKIIDRYGYTEASEAWRAAAEDVRANAPLVAVAETVQTIRATHCPSASAGGRPADCGLFGSPRFCHDSHGIECAAVDVKGKLSVRRAVAEDVLLRTNGAATLTDAIA